MKILVGIKHVPDTETRVRLTAEGAFDAAAVAKWIISPYDEFALEQALRFHEAAAGEVVAVCLGPPAAQQTLRQALAMGADRAILVADARFERSDGLARAKALAALVREEQPELVLLGKYGVGTDESQTGPMLAELLGWPHVGAATALELVEPGFRARRPVEGAVEVVEGSLPAVVSCDKGMNEPRYPSLKGIMQAKKKPLATRVASDVGLAEDALEQPAVVWESLELPAGREAARILGGSPDEAARELLRLLHEEEKVL